MNDEAQHRRHDEFGRGLLLGSVASEPRKGFRRRARDMHKNSRKLQARMRRSETEAVVVLRVST